VGVVGLGYVGLATATAFAAHGIDVVGFDIDARRRRAVAGGRSPVFDPGLPELLRSVTKSGRFTVASTLQTVIDNSDLIFLSVPTPSRPNGAIDLAFLRSAASAVGTAIGSTRGWVSVIVKSTVLPGTVDRVVEPILQRRSGRVPGADFGVGSNPEFLSEGTMVEDATHPHRVIIGISEPRTERLLRAVYSRFDAPILTMSRSAAELVKYASNGMLATRVSYANEIARVAELAGVDVYQVMEGVGLDPRIGPLFLRAGPGFGGSCFTKDLRALVAFGRAGGLPMDLAVSVLAVNESQARHIVDMAAREVGVLRRRKVALLGLAFKAETDDVRDSRAYPLLKELLRRGARPILHDPRATANFLRGLPDHEGSAGKFVVATSAKTALATADLAIIQCDWKQYAQLPASAWARLHRATVIDARRSLDPRKLKLANVRYVAVGLGRPGAAATTPGLR
jgi:UDPglucose 6-dehydrogenase